MDIMTFKDWRIAKAEGRLNIQASNQQQPTSAVQKMHHIASQKSTSRNDGIKPSTVTFKQLRQKIKESEAKHINAENAGRLLEVITEMVREHMKQRKAKTKTA